MTQLTAGTLLQWIDPEPGSKPIGIVLAPPTTSDEDMIFVLIIDHQGAPDVEVFVGRCEATGSDAANLVLQSMEVAEDGDPELIGALRMMGPAWWHVSAHLDGGHANRMDVECPLCQGLW